MNTVNTFSDLQTGDQYVLQRLLTNQVVVSSPHPILGPVYWHFVDESNCNAPDYFGLTTDVESALHLNHDWRDDAYLRGRWNSFMLEVKANSDEIDYELYGPRRENDDEYALWVIDIAMTGNLAVLERQAGGPPGSFYAWLQSAQWRDVAVSTQSLFLENMNGFTGYKPEWTANPREALLFSKSEIDGGDPEAELFKGLGRFVPSSCVMELPSNSDVDKCGARSRI